LAAFFLTYLDIQSKQCNILFNFVLFVTKRTNMFRQLFSVIGFIFLVTTCCFSQGRNVRDTLLVIDTLVVYDTLTISKETGINETAKVTSNSKTEGFKEGATPNRFKNMYNMGPLKTRWNYSTKK
jgi:hypothetical protein